MRVLFLGTGDIAIPSLKWLAGSPEHELVGLVTQPDKPSGRKLRPTPPKIKTVTESLAAVPILQPRRIRDHAEDLRGLSADIFVVMAYGQLLPQKILDIPPVACINLHASILPKHRGASPIQAAILAGDFSTGISVMHMAKSLDTGDIVCIEKVPITPDETGGSLHDKLAELSPHALEKGLSLLAGDNAPRTPQDDTRATYAHKLDRGAGKIDWTQSAKSIDRMVRAFDPWPGTSSLLPDGATLKLFPPVDVSDSDAGPTPGVVISATPDGIAVATGEGIIRFHSVQAQNRKRLPAADFLNGTPLVAGDILGG